MKLTKYGHACFTVEHDGKVLVVDPGVLSPDFAVSDNIVAVVVTHAHPDHFDPDKLATIYGKNPKSVLYSTSEVTEKMSDHTSQSVSPGDIVKIGPFELQFFGGEHAAIHETVPVINNVGVFINNTVYYPGDSLSLPNLAVDTLALPLGAPWLKTSEAIDFMVTVNPKHVFPTHDAVLSSDGQAFNDSWLKRFAEPLGIVYTRLDNNPIDV